MTTLPRRFGAVLALTMVLGGSLAACSATIDNDKMDKELTKFYEKGDPNAKVTDVSCPDSPKAEKGEKFTCSFELQTGDKGKFEVVVKNSDGDVSYKLTDKPPTVINVKQADEAIAADIRTKSGSDVKAVNCPKVIAGATGAKTVCPFEMADGGTGEATVSVADQDGNITWEYTKLPE